MPEFLVSAVAEHYLPSTLMVAQVCHFIKNFQDLFWLALGCHIVTRRVPLLVTASAALLLLCLVGRGQLNKERERSRQWAAKFTDLEVLYESLLEQEAVRQGSSCPAGTSSHPPTPDGPLGKKLYIDVGAASGATTPSGEQGEGLSGAAAAASTVAAGLVRKFSHTGWGGLGGLMRSGTSLVAAMPGAGTDQELLPSSSSRRASTPGGDGFETNELVQAGLQQQRSARHSIA